MTDYDIVILGGGSAGIVSGVMAGSLGMRVLLVEKFKLGGECLNSGCVPSKALLHAAKVAQIMRTADCVGLPSHNISRSDSDGVFSKVREAINEVRSADATEKLLVDSGVTIKFGNAALVDEHTLNLNGERIKFGNAIVATGSRPAIPIIPGLGNDYLTNVNIFDLNEIPKRFLVVGGGPVGVEMAQAFARLGSRVTLVQRSATLLPRDDVEVSRALTGYLVDEGIDIRLGCTIRDVRTEDKTRIASVITNGARSDIPFDQVLLATGRMPNVEGLSLERIGVNCSESGVVVDNRLRTTVPNIYACGDVTGKYQYSHMAEYEAKLVVGNIVFPKPSRADFTTHPSATFTDPEVVHIGMTEQEATGSGLKFDVLRQPFSQNDRAITEHDTRGFIKVLTQGLQGKILGVHIIGPRAGELAQEWILAMQLGKSIRTVADLIHVYPTLSLVNQHVAQRWYESKSKEPLFASLIRGYARIIRPNGVAIRNGALLLTAGAILAAIGRKRH